MRTIDEIEDNILNVKSAIKFIDSQINLLEEEYQADAMECIGSRSITYDEMISKLTAAKEALDALYHMESDLVERL